MLVSVKQLKHANKGVTGSQANWLPVVWAWDSPQALAWAHHDTVLGADAVTPMGVFTSGETTWLATNTDSAIYLRWRWVVSGGEVCIADAMAIETNLVLRDGDEALGRLEVAFLLGRWLCEFDWAAEVGRFLQLQRAA